MVILQFSCSDHLFYECFNNWCFCLIGSFCHSNVEPEDSHILAVLTHISSPAEQDLNLIYSRAAGSSSQPLQPGAASLGSARGIWPCAGSELVQSQVPKPQILAQGFRPNGFRAGKGALRTVSVFQQHITKDRLKEFSDKEIGCSLRVQMPLSLWGWWGLCYYLGPVQFLLVARLHFSK